MKTSRLLLLALTLPNIVLAQGSLTPPGPPAALMKTLDQVEPRKPINSTNTPGDANSVFKITASGSYYLTGNVTGQSGKNGIEVAATDVTIDLRGFSLNGASGALDGIHAEPGSARLTVRNGTISNWPVDGVDEVDGDCQEGIYENIRATGNGGDGLRLDAKCVVTACKLDNNTVYGMTVDGSATIKNCTANNNVADGFFFGAGSILDSVAYSNTGSGIESFDEPVLIKNCVAFENGDAGLRTGGGGKVSDSISRMNFTGIDLGFFSAVTNCTVKNNFLGIFGGGSNHIVGNVAEGNGNGIEVSEHRNVIDGNQVLNGGTGIKVTDSRNLIIRNRVANNSTNFDLAPDNRYGPVVDLTAGGTPAVSGNSATETLTTDGTHPWANFTYAQEPP